MALRPFTLEEIQELVTKGYDMSHYKGEAVDVPEPTHVDQTSALGTGLRSAAASAIPSAASGAGFFGGMKAGAALGALSGNPIVAGAGGLIGGIAGGFGAGKIAAAG